MKLHRDWEKDFYEGAWEPNSIEDKSEMEKQFVNQLTELLPRHMPVYDWNLPYAEAVLLLVRRHFIDSPTVEGEEEER